MRARLDLQHRRVSIAAISAAISVALSILVTSSAAHAQSAEAEALFDDGNRLMTSGKLAQACDAFEASNRVEPRAGTLIRLGECREQNQQMASAWSAYRDALTRVKDPRKRDYAQGKAAAMEARLSYLTVSVSDESRIEGLTITRNGAAFDQALWNRALPVDGGDYVISGHAPGHEEWQTTAHVPAEHAKISVEVPKFKELAKLAPPATPVPPKPAAQPAGGEPRDGDATPPHSMFTTRRKIALGMAGASVISVVAGVVLWSSAQGKQDDAFKQCPDPMMVCAQASSANALIQSSHSWALGANIAYGVAAAAAIGAGVLWFTGAPTPETGPRVSVVPSLSPAAPGVLVQGRF